MNRNVRRRRFYHRDRREEEQMARELARAARRALLFVELCTSCGADVDAGEKHDPDCEGEARPPSSEAVSS